MMQQGNTVPVLTSAGAPPMYPVASAAQMAAPQAQPM